MTDVDERGPSQLRELLIGAALKILAEPDTPLDLRKVAEVAGKSRTAPYLVFGKESEGGGLLGLRIAVAAEGAGRLARRMQEAAGGADPLVAFRAVALAFLSFALDHPRLFRLMFGSDLGIPRQPPGSFAGHPEFQRLVRRRQRAESALHGIVVACRDARLLPEVDEIGALRYTMVAWATMVGVAFLLIDEVPPAAGMSHDLDDAASLVVESVVGVDPERLRHAAWTFLRAQSMHAVLERAPRYEAAGRAGEDPLTSGELHHAIRERGPTEAPGPEPADLTGTLSSHRGLWRAAQAREALHGARILWVDDEPGSVRFEAEALSSLGARVEPVRDTAAATALLGRQSFDLVISDIARADDPAAGLAGLPELRRWAPDTPVVFYVRALDRTRGVPPGAFGIADDVDELFHLIVDALERRRG